jgi:hypothetical protein
MLASGGMIFMKQLDLLGRKTKKAQPQTTGRSTKSKTNPHAIRIMNMDLLTVNQVRYEIGLTTLKYRFKAIKPMVSAETKAKIRTTEPWMLQ